MTNHNFAMANFLSWNFILYMLKWMLLTAVIGAIIGSATAFFLASLEWVTHFRESHLWVIALLPFGGLLIGLAYHYWGTSVVKGNNLLLEEFHSPKQTIPLKMAPLVLFGTLVTHLFGGSAGREGTAVQIGGAFADQFSRFLKLRNDNRKILIIVGISGGFAAVFGTPFAGAVFALEVLVLRRVLYEAILPAVLAAVVADYACKAWGIVHTAYAIPFVPPMAVPQLLWTAAAGIAFGLAAFAFSRLMHFFSRLFTHTIHYPPLRPVVGGVMIAGAVWALGTTQYIGLGIPTIQAAFLTHLPGYDFLLKLLFTTFTLSAGFKGGEVTPLFFIGATLGSALCFLVPLPCALLAGMGFVAVFSGATNTPVASTLMGIELFGAEGGLYLGIVCFVAYLFSGRSGIYTSQIAAGPKHLLYRLIQRIRRRKWDNKI